MRDKKARRWRRRSVKRKQKRFFFTNFYDETRRIRRVIICLIACDKSRRTTATHARDAPKVVSETNIRRYCKRFLEYIFNGSRVFRPII